MGRLISTSRARPARGGLDRFNPQSVSADSRYGGVCHLEWSVSGFPGCGKTPHTVILRRRSRSRSLRSGQALSETREGPLYLLEDSNAEILRFAQDDSEGFRMTAPTSSSAACFAASFPP